MRLREEIDLASERNTVAIQINISPELCVELDYFAKKIGATRAKFAKRATEMLIEALLAEEMEKSGKKT